MHTEYRDRWAPSARGILSRSLRASLRCRFSSLRLRRASFSSGVSFSRSRCFFFLRSSPLASSLPPAPPPSLSLCFRFFFFFRLRRSSSSLSRREACATGMDRQRPHGQAKGYAQCHRGPCACFCLGFRLLPSALFVSWAFPLREEACTQHKGVREKGKRMQARESQAPRENTRQGKCFSLPKALSLRPV